MTYKISEAAMARVIEARAAKRDERVVELLSMPVASLHYQALQHGVRRDLPAPDMAQMIVDIEYPDMFDIESPIKTDGPVFGTRNFKPEMIHDEKRLDLSGFKVPDDTIPAEPPKDLSRYADMFDQAEPIQHSTTSADMARMVGGFEPEHLTKRAFVGFADRDGSVVKLDVNDVVKVSGLDADSRDKRSVVMVNIPGWWLDVDYIKEYVTRLYAGALSGEPESVIDVLLLLCKEQGWDLDKDFGPAQPPQETLPGLDETQHIPYPATASQVASYLNTGAQTEVQTPIADSLGNPSYEPTQVNPQVGPSGTQIFSRNDEPDNQ